jgi:antitoxin VapB
VSPDTKNEETHRLSQELAGLTGESLTDAVTQSVRERLVRVRAQTGNGLAQKIVRIGEDCASRLKEPYLSSSHGELLYDEQHLPK